MAKATEILTNFTAGEFSPLLEGRVDLDKYKNGAKIVENMTVFPHGGATRRVGSKFIARGRNDNKSKRLIPFEFNVTQSYMLEFGDSYIKFYRNQGQISATKTITGATQANPVVITAVAHSFVNGDTVDIDSVGGMTEINNRTFEIAGVTANTFELVGEDGTGHTAYTSGGNATGGITISSPYLEAELDELQFAQDADILYIVHPNHKPMELTRTSHTVWTLTNYAPTNDPFTSANNYPSCVVLFEQRIWFAATNTNPQTIWASKSGDLQDMTTGTNADDALSYDIGSGQVNVIRWLDAVQTLLVGTVGGEFVVSGGVDTAITPTNVRVVRESSYGSAYTLPTRVANQTLFVQRAERKIRQLVFSFDVDGYIAPDLTILSEHITEGGVKALDFQQEPSSIVWMVRNDGTLLGLTYQPDQEVTGWHRHILGGVSDTAGTQAQVESIAVIPPVTPTGRDEVWVSVKRLINGTTLRHIEVLDEGMDLGTDIEFAHFVDSGLSLNVPVTVSGATQADPVVITATSHGFSDGDTVAFREVKGMTELNGKKYKINNKTANTFELQSLAVTPVDIDGTGFSAYISGGEVRKAVTSVSGLEHLEGETVSILADGSTHPDEVVSSGGVTLDRATAIAQIGLPYTSTLQTSRLEAGSADGTAQTKTKRIRKVGLRFDRTVGAKFGPDEDNLDIIPFRQSSDPMDEPLQPFSGDKLQPFPNGNDTDARIMVKQDQPLPMTVLSVIAQVKTND